MDIISDQVVPSTDISVVKLANKKRASVGESLEFTIIISNEGTVDAQGVTLIDNVANTLKLAIFSLDNGTTWNLWNGRVTIGALLAGATSVILLRGIIKPTCAQTLINIADVTSTTIDSNLNNNRSAVFVGIKRCCYDRDRCCCDRDRCCCDKEKCCCNKEKCCCNRNIWKPMYSWVIYQI